VGTGPPRQAGDGPEDASGRVKPPVVGTLDGPGLAAAPYPVR
jgi:hypothetical protein